MKTLIPALLLGIIFFVSCKDAGTETSPDNTFAIYRLLDTSLVAFTASQLAIGDLTLASDPFMRATDLTAYHWSTHTFVPKPALDSTLHRMASLPGKSGGIPFVVIVGENRIYVGTLWWAYSSSTPPVPYIELLPSGSYAIEAAPFSSLPDPRQDPRIWASLRAAGILVE